ncbi:hypothetical protein [Nocardia tengchongensis]|uniref:hypothetical protein n=1 Tax=Nocardia tengchongensis TaxID=2055889 RepID=UPI00369297C8
MTSDQYQPYPNPQHYEPFGAGQSYPVGPTPGGATPPRTVTYAFYLMLSGAALSLVGLLYGLTELPHLRATALAKDSGKGTLSDSQIDTIVTVSFVVGCVVALISVGLWIWMAFANRAGKNWARITATVFFGLYTVDTLATVTVGDGTATSTAITVLTWLVGLATVILLWIKQSGTHFQPAPASTPYSAGTYPTGPQDF